MHPYNPSQYEIVVIDDDTNVHSMLSPILEKEGYKVRCCTSGEIAITSILEKIPDLILLDILMPEMNGFEVCCSLKENSSTADIPVLFMSGIDEVASKVRCFEVGGVDCISKPIEPFELLARVKLHVQLYHLQQTETKNRADEINSIIQTAMDGFWITSLDGRILQVNDTYCKMSGYSREELLTMSIADLEQKETVDDIAAHREKIKRNFGDRFETVHRRKDGSIFFVEISVQHSKDHFNCFLRDISERKQAEEELQVTIETWKQQNQFTESLLNLSPNIVYIYDLVGKKNIYSNDGVQRNLGYSVAEIKEMGSNIFPLLMHPEDLQNYIKNTLPKYACAKDGKQILTSYRMKHKNGEWHWFSSNELIYKRSDDGSPIQIFGVMHDITESKQMVDELHESEWKFQALFQKGPIGVAYHEIICDESGKPIDYRFLDANKQYIELTGVDPRGKTVTEAFPGIENDPADWIGTFGNVAITGETIRFQQYLQPNDRWYDVVGYQYKPNHFVAAFNEITAQKKVEHDLHTKSHILSETEKLGNVGGWELHTDTQALFWTDETYRIHELDQSYVPTVETAIGFYAEQSVPIISEAVSRAIELGEDFDLELEIITAKGNHRYVHSIGNFDAQNQRIYGFFQDITDRKKAEIALSTSEQRYRSLLQNLDAGVIVHAPDTTIILNNSRASELLGLSDEQLQGKQASDPQWKFLDTTNKSLPLDQYPVNRIVRSKKPMVNQLLGVNRPASNDIVWLLVNGVPLFDSEQNITEILVSFIDITDQKQAEVLLQKSEEQHRYLFENIPLGVIYHRADGSIELANSAAQEILGATLEQLQGKTAMDPRWKGIHEDGSDYPGETHPSEITRKTGKPVYNAVMGVFNPICESYRWININSVPQFDENNVVSKEYVTFEDITEQKNAEQLLKRSEELYRLINEASLDQIYSYDLENRFTSANKILCDNLHLTVEEVVGKTYREFGFPEELCSEWDEWHRDVYANGPKTITTSTPMPNGSTAYFEVVLSPMKDSAGNNIGIAGVNRNITERKQTEIALQESEERFRSLFQNLPLRTAIWELIRDENHEIVDWKMEEVNPLGAADLFASPESLIGVSAKSLFGDAVMEPYLKLCKEVVASKQAKQIETYFEVNNKYYLSVLFTIGTKSYVTMSIDITDKKQAEQELADYRDHLEDMIEERTAELAQTIENLEIAKDTAEAANRAKTIFLSTMSHELRTPLNAILGFSEILEREAVPQSLQESHLGIIHKSGEHLLSIINDILDLAKIESGKITLDPQEFDLGELTNDLVSMLRIKAESKGLTLDLNQTSSFPRFIKADPAKLRQIIINLVGNAIKFTSEGTVSLKMSAHGELHDSKLPHICFEICDTGAGIAESNIDKVFQPFVQLGTHEGTGLGLTITQQFVKLMGGELSVASTLGEGSTFRFCIAYEPVQTEMINALSATTVVSEIKNGTDFRILIVEDHPENRQLLRQLLEPFGFKISEAQNGREGVDLFESWKPHCVLMDRRMPIMDGLESTKLIRKNAESAEVVIIGVTAQAFKDEQSEMIDAGCNGFIAKPFRAEELFAVLEQLLPLEIVHAESELPFDDESEKPSPESIAQIPADLKARFVKALEASNMAEINSCIAEIVVLDFALGKWLVSKAESFEYGFITNALEGNII